MRPPEGFEWVLILFIVLLLFGHKRLPDMARGIGRSLRILKAETKGLATDDAVAEPAVVAPAPQVVAEPAPAEKPQP